MIFICRARNKDPPVYPEAWHRKGRSRLPPVSCRANAGNDVPGAQVEKRLVRGRGVYFCRFNHVIKFQFCTKTLKPSNITEKKLSQIAPFSANLQMDDTATNSLLEFFLPTCLLQGFFFSPPPELWLVSGGEVFIDGG